MNTHGSIGPSCAVAEYKNGKLTVWTPSQADSPAAAADSRPCCGIKPENVRCIYVEGSGCYGRNGHEDAAAEAALIAKEIGRPVRVQWMREDEHGWDPKGPPTLLDYRGALDDEGRHRRLGVRGVHARAAQGASRSRCSRRSSRTCPRTRTPAASNQDLASPTRSRTTA